MLVKFTCGYGTKVTPAELEQLNSCIINGTELTVDPEPDEDGRRKISNTWTENVAFIDDLKAIRGLQIQITDFPSDNWTRRLLALRSIEEQPAAKVVVPGLGLLLISRVKMLKNPSEPDLNELLEAGWRIMAVLPLRSGKCNYQLGYPGDKLLAQCD